MSKYLCIKQPWASLIMEGLKDVENRRKPDIFKATYEPVKEVCG